MKFKIYLVIIAICLGYSTLSSILSAEESVSTTAVLSLDSNKATSGEPDYVKTSSGEYRIGIEDMLAIMVWQHSDLSITAAVGPDGKISMPLAGEITAKGLTKTEVQDLIAARLAKYVRDPVVTVNITEYTSRRIRVLGQVNQPGMYTFSGQITLLDAIARAGGPTITAQLHQCAIFRGTETVFEVDVYELLYEKNMQLNIPLEPNDTLFVPDNLNARVFVLGEVKNPGLYDIGGRLTVLEAIEKAGSYTDNASLRYVRIVRGDLNHPKIIPVDIKAQVDKGITPKNQNLKPNDIVFVPKGTIGKLNFVLNQISPSLRTIILGDSARNVFQNKQSLSPSITLP